MATMNYAITTSRYFHPSRTQPFVVTFFQAVMAFKRICKMMKRRRSAVKLKNRAHVLTSFTRQIRNSNVDQKRAKKGMPVVRGNIEEERTLSASEALAQLRRSHSTLEAASKNLLKRKSTMRALTSTFDEATATPARILFRAVAAQIEDFNRKRLTEKGTLVSDKLEKSLKVPEYSKLKVISPALKLPPPQSGAVNDGGGVISSLAYKNEYLYTVGHDNAEKNVLSNNNASDPAVFPPTAHQAAIEVIEYLPGTSIYFGATLALQARHGGYLSYSGSTDLRASAHKVLSNSRYIVKNSEDLTDIGTLKYGDAIWLQTGPNDVLGAEYSKGTAAVTNQRRKIQPAIINWRRGHMLKAQQYGRWIILNRDRPMDTIGQQVLHQDYIMLEQEWFYLASSSPYDSHMFKMLNNSDEAMTTRRDLFAPGSECVWKVHLIGLPSDDKKEERQRQQLLQHAKDQIDESRMMRGKKVQNLIGSLSLTLPILLTDDGVVAYQLPFKRSKEANNEHLMQKYNEAGKRHFSSFSNTLNTLRKVYGNESPIVQYHIQRLELREAVERKRLAQGGDSWETRDREGATANDRGGGNSDSKERESKRRNTLFITAPEGMYNPQQSVASASTGSPSPSAPPAGAGAGTGDPLDLSFGNATKRDILQDRYWRNAQKLLVDSKGWSSADRAMNKYYEKDIAKKINAAVVLQRGIRRFIKGRFNYARRLKESDEKVQEKLIAKATMRRKMLLEHAAAVEAISVNNKGTQQQQQHHFHTGTHGSITPPESPAVGMGANHHQLQLSTSGVAGGAGAGNTRYKHASFASISGSTGKQQQQMHRTRRGSVYGRHGSMNSTTSPSAAAVVAAGGGRGAKRGAMARSFAALSPALAGHQSQQRNISIFSHKDVSAGGAAGGGGMGYSQSQPMLDTQQQQAGQARRGVDFAAAAAAAAAAATAAGVGFGIDILGSFSAAGSPMGSPIGNAVLAAASGTTAAGVRDARFGSLSGVSTLPTTHEGFKSSEESQHQMVGSSSSSDLHHHHRRAGGGGGVNRARAPSLYATATSSFGVATDGMDFIAEDDGGDDDEDEGAQAVAGGGGSGAAGAGRWALDFRKSAGSDLTGFGGANEGSSSFYRQQQLQQLQQQQQQLHQKQRPHTAGEILRPLSGGESNMLAMMINPATGEKLPRRQYEKMQNQLAMERLCRSKTRDYGLPPDVFEDFHTKVSLNTGVKFLQAMSTNPDIYTDVSLKRRAGVRSAEGHRDKGKSRRSAKIRGERHELGGAGERVGGEGRRSADRHRKNRSRRNGDS